MKEVLLNIPDNKFKTFLEFLKQIPFVKIVERKIRTNRSEKIEFTVMKVNKKNFKFNRDELNER